MKEIICSLPFYESFFWAQPVSLLRNLVFRAFVVLEVWAFGLEMEQVIDSLSVKLPLFKCLGGRRGGGLCWKRWRKRSGLRCIRHKSEIHNRLKKICLRMMGLQEGLDRWAQSPNKIGKAVSSAACVNDRYRWNIEGLTMSCNAAAFLQFNNSAWVISFRGHRWWKAKARILKAVCFQMECWAVCSVLMPVDYIQGRYQRRHWISLSQLDGGKYSSSYREALLVQSKDWLRINRLAFALRGHKRLLIARLSPQQQTGSELWLHFDLLVQV